MVKGSNLEGHVTKASFNAVRLIIGILLALGLVFGSAFLGMRVGMIYKVDRILLELSLADSMAASLRQALHIQTWYAAGQQDMWVALAVKPGKRDGFYVDVGSADGIQNSNTYVFDRLGWKGICIDPFPTNMEKRTCQMFRQPVFSESGKKVQFRVAGENGGIVDTMNRYKDSNSQAPLVEFVTATLDEILEKAKAPRHIDYLSIDVEGAELNVLQGFSLNNYEVDALTIEHNNEPVKRAGMRQLLERNGYERVRSWVVDDWYVRKPLAARYELTLDSGFRNRRRRDRI
jgi:FkbM family methyltransferase